MKPTDLPAFAGADGRADASPDGDAGGVDGPAPPVSFDAAETRVDDMHATIDSWLEELRELVDDARGTERFQAWLDVQSRFHDYSARNTLLIACQRPDATRVAGYRTWQEEFDRQVRAGEEAIWIWAPIVARRCPECENSRRYHEQSDCEYDEIPPEAWSTGVVAFKPVPVFDVAQTEGEPLPELETAARGDGTPLLGSVLDAADSLGIAASVVPPDEWAHGAADGVCQPPDGESGRPRVAVRAGPDAAVVGTLVHELAHARLHFDVERPAERAKREVEAEAVAYVVGRHFGLDTSNSAFYLAAWQDDDRETLGDRLRRIRRTAAELIGAIEDQLAAG